MRTGSGRTGAKKGRGVDGLRSRMLGSRSDARGGAGRSRGGN